MADFSYVTKTGRSPQGKQRVYFTCYPDDFEDCFEDICGDILKNQDCAVYYLDPEVLPEEVEDYELQLSSMQLFVIPVTSDLLTENCRRETFFISSSRLCCIPFFMHNASNPSKSAA